MKAQEKKALEAKEAEIKAQEKKAKEDREDLANTLLAISMSMANQEDGEVTCLTPKNPSKDTIANFAKFVQKVCKPGYAIPDPVSGADSENGVWTYQHVRTLSMQLILVISKHNSFFTITFTILKF